MSKTVEFHKKLIECLLLLVMPAKGIGAPRTPKRVKLVYEDDRRGLLAGLLEQVSHARGTDTDEHFNVIKRRPRVGLDVDFRLASPD